MDDFQGALTKSGSAYEYLRRLVVEGRLRPDRRLAPSDLANVFRVSVTPVRDALVRLAAEGFIHGEAGRGYFSKRYTVEEQHDLLKVMAMALLTSLLDFGQAPDPAVDAAFAEVAAFLHGAAGDAAAAAGYHQAEEALLAAAAARSGGELVPGLIRNAAARTRFVRRLDADEPGRRAATAGRLVEVGARLRAGDQGGAVSAGRRFVAEYKPNLPDLVRRANALIEAQPFP